jgi:uncharacterized protein YfaT (DUF1175 family)
MLRPWFVLVVALAGCGEPGPPYWSYGCSGPAIVCEDGAATRISTDWVDVGLVDRDGTPTLSFYPTMTRTSCHIGEPHARAWRWY